MKADSAYFKQQLNKMSYADLIAVALKYYEKCSRLRAELDELKNTFSYTADELKKAKAECEDLAITVDVLNHENTRLQNQADELKKNRFGRKSEKMDGKIHDDEFRDPLSEEMDESDYDGEKQNKNDSQKARKIKRPSCKQLNRKKKIRQIPEMTIIDFDREAIDKEYGYGKWTLKGWNISEEFMFIPGNLYRVHVKRPVIRVYDDDDTNDLREVALPVNKLMLRSKVTPSLLAFIMSFKFVLGVPLARLSRVLSYQGINLSKEIMSDWVIKCTDRYLKPVYSEIMRQMACRTYTQIDETYLEVINDGRNAGSKSYIWCHITGEFEEERPLAVFCFELTRSADHLLEFYEDLNDGIIHLTSDAYSAYYKLASEKKDHVILGGCFMHLRRRLYKAYEVKFKAVKDKKLLEESPEKKCIDIIGDLYSADDDAKELTAEERAKVRDEIERPLVDAYFDYIKSLDISNGTFSEEMEDAVSYSLNHEDAFRVFLDDPMVPIDNGECERKIRNIAMVRNNSLFCYSIGGAETLCIIMTLIETAKSNGCDPHTYLEYLFESSLAHASVDISEYIDEMMPWSSEYQKFEEERFSRPLGKIPDFCTEEPEMPVKADVDTARAERRHAMVTENINSTTSRPAA